MKETNNIGHHETVALADLNLYHKNPRRGDVSAIKGSILANGVYRAPIVNKGTHTGRPYEIAAGNHQITAMRELAEETGDAKWQYADVWMIDVDEERLAKIVLADNRTADLGSYDNDELLGLLDQIESDLDGTGYDQDDLQMLRDLASGPDSLDDLEEEFGEPEDDDFWITVRLRVPPPVNEQWVDWLRAYDSPEEAFEAMLDRAGGYEA